MQSFLFQGNIDFLHYYTYLLCERNPFLDTLVIHFPHVVDLVSEILKRPNWRQRAIAQRLTDSIILFLYLSFNVRRIHVLWVPLLLCFTTMATSLLKPDWLWLKLRLDVGIWRREHDRPFNDTDYFVDVGSHSFEVRWRLHFSFDEFGPCAKGNRKNKNIQAFFPFPVPSCSLYCSPNKQNNNNPSNCEKTTHFSTTVHVSLPVRWQQTPCLLTFPHSVDLPPCTHHKKKFTTILFGVAPTIRTYTKVTTKRKPKNRYLQRYMCLPDWRATISESYITYLHFDDKVSTALPRSRHKTQRTCYRRKDSHRMRKY